MEGLAMPNCGQDAKEKDHIQIAGDNVGLDLKRDINVAQMIVLQASKEPNQEDRARMHWLRKSILWTQVFNELGEPEELTITFELKSQRSESPKKKQS